MKKTILITYGDRFSDLPKLEGVTEYTSYNEAVKLTEKEERDEKDYAEKYANNPKNLFRSKKSSIPNVPYSEIWKEVSGHENFTDICILQKALKSRGLDENFDYKYILGNEKLLDDLCNLIKDHLRKENLYKEIEGVNNNYVIRVPFNESSNIEKIYDKANRLIKMKEGQISEEDYYKEKKLRGEMPDSVFVSNSTNEG